MNGPLDHPVTVPGALPVLTEELEAAVGIARGAAATSEAAPVHLAMSVPVRLPTATVAGVHVAPEPAEAPAGTPTGRPAGAMAPALDARAIEDEVMAELAQRIDLMFEYRLREALAPTLARAADLLIREAREEVALTLRDVVSRAVAQQIARRRTGR